MPYTSRLCTKQDSAMNRQHRKRALRLPLRIIAFLALYSCASWFAAAVAQDSGKNMDVPAAAAQPQSSPPAAPSRAADYEEPYHLAMERFKALIQNPIRTERDRQMDGARRPVEFLHFTKVKAGMNVLDLSAGAGYTAQLLALAVGANGKVWAQREQPGEPLTKRLADNPQPQFVAVYRPFEDPVPPELPKLDLVTFVNNYHDIAYLPVDRAKMNKRIFDALKPGGYYVIVDHSASAGSGTSVAKSLHRIEETVVVNEVQKAGFVLDDEGRFLRNVADTREDTSNSSKVPTDKFVLRFMKPKS